LNTQQQSSPQININFTLAGNSGLDLSSDVEMSSSPSSTTTSNSTRNNDTTMNSTSSSQRSNNSGSTREDELDYDVE
jgi:hypothetical protein